MEAPDVRFGYQTSRIARVPPWTGLWAGVAVALAGLPGPVGASVDRPGVTLEETVLEASRGFSLDEGFERLPGLSPVSRYALDPEPRVRQGGRGAPFLEVDGQPWTASDGSSRWDGVDMGAVRSLDAHPAGGALPWGNGADGTVALTTLERPEDGEDLAADVLVGSNRERAQRVWGGVADGPWSSAAHASNVEWGGYRDHADRVYRRLAFQVGYRPGRNEELEVTGRLLDAPRTQDPRLLTRQELAEDREQAAPDAEELDAGRELEEQALGVRWTSRPVANERWMARAQVRRWDEERRFAREHRGFQELESHDVTAGAEHELRTRIGEGRAVLTFGVDGAWQRDERTERRNEDGRAGARWGESLGQIRSGGLRGRLDWKAAPDWRLRGGLRLDRGRMSVRDEFGDAATQRMSFTEPSWDVETAHEVVPRQHLYVGASGGFRTPRIEAQARQALDGDDLLDPERRNTLRVGARGALGADARWDLSVFDTRVDDLLIPSQASDAEPPRYRNVREARFRGIDAAMHGTLAPRLEAVAVGTYGDFRYERTEDDAFDDRRMPGAPRAYGYAELAWSSPVAWRVAVDVRAAGRAPANDTNTVEADAYREWGMRVTRTYTTEAWEARPYFAVVNLTDEEHEAVAQVNAAGDRAFEPAPERTFYAGVTFRSP